MGNQVIHIETEGLLRIKQLSNSLSDKMSEAMKQIDKVINSDGWNCPEKRKMSEGLSNLSRVTRSAKHAGTDYAIEASTAAQCFEECARRANGIFSFWSISPEMWQVVNESMGETVISPIGPKTFDWLEKLKICWLNSSGNSGQLLGTTLQIYAGLVGAGIIVSPFLLPTVVNNMINSTMEEVNSTSNNQSSTSSGAPKQPLPDYARQPKPLLEESGFYHCNFPLKGADWEWKKLENEGKYPLSCTFYTARKLRERGIEYPAYTGPGNGNSWYSNLDPAAKAVLPNTTGPINQLKTLLSQESLPQDNIVISFGSGEYGHVVLIDHARVNAQGDVELVFSDNRNPWTGEELYVSTDYLNHHNLYNSTETNTDDLYATNEPITKTLDQFIEKYRTVGNMNGAVILGAGEGSY